MGRIAGTSTAFLLGFGFALLPAIGPFLAAILFITSRIDIRRTEALWAAAGLLYAVPLVVTGNVEHAASSFFQVIAGWLIYRAFAAFGRLDDSLLRNRGLGSGLVAGLAFVIALNLMNVEAWNFATAKTIAQAIVWESSPALFGHTALVLGGLIAILVRSRTIRLTALGLSALAILVSGSREAAFGWLLIAVVGAAVHHRASSWRGRLIEFGVIGLMVIAATGLGPRVGWGNVGFLLQPSAPDSGTNLLQGTEVPEGDWWDRSWVSVNSREVVLGGEQLAAYRIEKSGSEGWLRLQQAVELQPATTYTVSAWIRSVEDAARPGIQGWGQTGADPEAPTFVMSGSLANGNWSAGVSGPGTLVDSGIAAKEGPWSRVFATFDYAGSTTMAWFVGLVPDSRDHPGTEAEFAGFQLEEGTLSPYEPGIATRGLSLATARVPVWRAAWEGIVDRPWRGWGAASFSDYFTDAWPERSRVHVVPAHAHNLFLHTWFERGVFGLAGILLFLGLLVLPALSRWDIPLLAFLAAVVLANVFDTTLLYGGVFYPLVAIAGWRLGSAGRSSREPLQSGRSFIARLGLAVADLVAAALALSLTAWAVGSLARTTGMPSWQTEYGVATSYALLLWPLLSWREGLYPGYGLTPQQELRKQATVTLYATVLLAVASVLLPDYPPIPWLAVLLLAFASLVALPAARALAKRLLYASGVWGRPVVVLGAGDTGWRIVRSLLRTPLDGLHPVAFFDDDPTLVGRQVQGVRVAGSLADADAYAELHGIHHAIVAIPSLSAHRLRDLLDTQGRTFKSVQFVPSLAGLPAEDVYASNLDGMLAIEIRNNLASTRNQIFKRTIDLVLGTIGLAFISPVLIVLAVWVRLDTRGPAMYRSKRIGEDGEVFECLKFRTMVVDAEDRLQQLMREDELVRDEYARFHKLEHDPRITRAGRFLRKYSLDELPQVLNVIMGQMSLVGPRPYLERELPLMGRYSDVILQAKPGMTGHWQVSERNDVTFQDRLEMEAHYVRNWSIWWDIVILVRTFPAVLERPGR